jgi:hypothetical protein
MPLPRRSRQAHERLLVRIPPGARPTDARGAVPARQPGGVHNGWREFGQSPVGEQRALDVSQTGFTFSACRRRRRDVETPAGALTTDVLDARRSDWPARRLAWDCVTDVVDWSMDRRGMAHRAKLIPGDGVGPEVCAAARRVLGGSGVDIERDVCGAGDAAERNTWPRLPAATVDSIRDRRRARGAGVDAGGGAVGQHRAPQRA